MKEWWVDWLKWLVGLLITGIGGAFAFMYKQFQTSNERQRSIEKLADALIIITKRLENHDTDLKEVRLGQAGSGTQVEKVRAAEANIEENKSNFNDLTKRVNELEKSNAEIKGRLHD